MKISADLLLARGFNSEKELNDFLNNCVDKNWVEELKEYYGLVNSDKIVEKTVVEEETIKTEDLQKDKKSKNKVKEEL